MAKLVGGETHYFRTIGIGDTAILILTGSEHLRLVVVEHIFERHPVALVRPAGRCASAAKVQRVAVDAITHTVLDIGIVKSGNVAIGNFFASGAGSKLGIGRRGNIRTGARGHPVSLRDREVHSIRNGLSGRLDDRRRESSNNSRTGK